MQHLVVYKKQENSILIQLKKVIGDSVICELEVPGNSPEAYGRAFKIGDKLLEQTKKATDSR